MPLQFGRQPARHVMIWKDMTVTEAAAAIGCPVTHLRNALLGRTRPNDLVRQRLPQLLGVPLEACFTAELLGVEYGGRRGRRGSRAFD